MVQKTADWMKRNLPGKAAQFGNLGAKIGGYGGVLPLTLVQIQAIQALCAAFVALYESTLQSQATDKSVTQWRDNAFYGTPKGAELTAAPTFATIVIDAAWTIGIIAQIREWRELILALPGYTQAIGEDLMIVAVDGDDFVEADVQPKIQVFAAQFDYHASVVVSDRADSDQWFAETRKKGGDWTSAGTFTGKAADITVAPTTPGEPFQIEVRVQLKRKNANYGQPSQIATTTLVP